MATLTGQEIRNTYQGLIKISDTTALSATAKYLSDGLGNNSALALSTSQAQIGGGSIGLNFPLTLRSNVNDYTKMLDWGTDAGGSWGTMTINTASPYETILKSGEWVFQTGSTEKMRITSAGNVGIGTSNPQDYTSVSANDLVIGNASGSRGLTISSGTTNYGNIAFADGTGALDQYRGLIQYGHASDAMIFFTNANERVRITSTGSVGIGTSSPSALLHLGNNGNTSAASLLIDSSTIADATAKFAHNANVEWTIGSDETSGTTNTRSFVFSKGSALGTNDRLVITHDGNVGVGTTSPSANLEVSRSTQQTDIGAAGQVLALLNTSADITNNATGIRFRQVNGTNNCNAFIGTLSSGSSANRSSLVFAPSNSSGDAVEVMRMTPAGNVGIGTANPATKLVVQGEIRSNDSGGYAALLASSALGYSILADTHTGGAMTIFTAGSEKMRITSAGNVGINTSAPDSLFHIQNLDGGSYRFGYGGTSDVYIDSDNVYYRSDAGGSNYMALISGNVGIGTITPETKLDVDGDIQTAAPETSTNAAWRLGNVGLGGVEVGPIDYITVSVGGFVVKLPIAIFPETQAFYDRVIADGGTFEGLLGYESAVTILKAQ